MPLPIDFDRPIGAATWQALPQVALYVLLSLTLGLPGQKAGWKKIFESSGAHSSASKALLLKVCFVANAILLSALSSEIIYQFAKSPKTVPEVSALWITPVTMM